MFKKSLLFMLLMTLLAPWAAKAQTTVLSENFDSMSTISTSYSATDWYAYNAGSGNNWELNTSSGYAHSGSNSAQYNYNSSNDANCYLVSAPFTVSAKMDELSVSVYEKVRSSSYAETFEVFFVKASDITDAASVATATQYSVIASASYNNATFAEVTGSNSNSALAGQSVRLVVHCTSEANMWALYIDDITVTETLAESCPKPKNLEATNITNESATLTWTSTETPSNGYNIRYRVAGDPNATFFDSFEEGLSQWTTLANDYDGSGTNWRQFDGSFNTPIPAHSGTYVAMSRSYDGDDQSVDNWLITPQVALDGTLKFWAINDDGAGYAEYYSIYVSTTGNDVADFTEVYVPADCTEWTEYSIDLSSYSGALGYIAIRHIDEAKDFLLIDDFGIYGDPIPAGAWVNTTSNTNSKDISGLTEKTLYDFEVQSNCGGETSTWAASTFTTNPSCMPVADLDVSDVTTTTISLTWTDQNSGAASYIVTDGDDNPVSVTNLTITGCTVTGLTANTAYTFKVKADCGSTAETINVRTECNALSTLPYEEGFEASSVNVYCWDLYGFNRLNNSTYAHDGTYSIFSQNESAACAILPATTTNISELMLNFWWYNYYSGYDLGTLEVGYFTDNTYSSFVSVGTIDMSVSSDTYTKSDDFTFKGAPAGALIALQYTEGSDGALVIIDDVTVDVAPSCMKPTALGATPSTTSAVLNWTANSGETSWNIYYKKTSETDYIEVSNVKENPYTLTPLVANTNYEYYVVANCSPTEPSDPSNVYYFKTTCGSVTSFPWDEDFEGMTASTVPECWDNSASTAQEITSNPQYIWGVYENSSNKMIRMYNYFVHTGTALINSPSIDLPSTGVYQLTFDYAHNASCGAFKVNISDDNGTTWVEKGSYTKGSGSSSSDPGTFTSVDPILLGDYAGQTIMIQFFANADYGSGAIFVDNVLINEAPNCIAPNGLSATPAATSAELSWTANSGETSWNIYYKKTSETDYTELKKVTDNPYTLPGLNPATDYEFYVVANCTATETSDPSSVYYFSTECEPFTVTATNKYTQDFESPVVTSTYSSTTDLHVPNCWENPYTTGTSAAGKPHLIAKGSSYNYSSNQVLNFYGSGSNYVTLPGFTNNLQDLQISFKWATESSTNGTLTLGYITDGDVNYNTFTEITGASYPASSSSYQTLIQADPVDLSELPTTAKRLAFRWVYSGQYSCNVDDLVVELIPTCKVPTSLTCTDYTATTATFDWNAVGTNQTAWQLYISDKNIAPANDIAESEVINVTTHPYTVTSGLVAEQTYYAWVRGNCTASSEGYSEWSEGIEFMPSQYKNFTYQEEATSSTGYVPVYGSYITNATNKGQILIPATYFPEAMADATVRRLTFYTTNSYPTADWGTAEFDVLVTEVDETSFATTAFFDWTTMTTVYSGSLSVSGNQMVIDLDTPFSYTGGNLVIGFNLTATGTNANVQWVATYGSTYLAAYQYGTSGTSSVYRTYYQPKTTFNYLPNPTPRPINPHPTEELSTEATVAWTAPNSTEVTGYQYQYKLATSTEWPTYYYDEIGLSATMTELTPEKTYDFRVRAVYPGPAYSQYAETEFTTTASCAIPDGLAAANLTQNTADLTWNASTEVLAYTVEYRTAAGMHALFEEGFEDATEFANWTLNNCVSGTTRATDYKRTGSYSFKFAYNGSSSGITPPQYLISPDLSAYTTSDVMLTFYYSKGSSSWTETFKVGWSSTTNDPAEFTWDSEITATSSWENYSHTIPAGTKYISIAYTADDQLKLFIDDLAIGNILPAGAWTAATTTAPNTGAYTIGGLTAGTKYDVRVYANCAIDPETDNTLTTFTTLADHNIVFPETGVWNSTNFEPAVDPTVADNVIIRANVTITDGNNAYANNVTLENGAVITIENGATLTIKGTVTGGGSNKIIIEDGGQLIHNNSVDATVKKNITAPAVWKGSSDSDGWYLIATPVYSTTISSTFTGVIDLFEYNEPAAYWYSYNNGDHTFSTMYRGTGYLHASQNNQTVSYAGSMISTESAETKSLSYTSTLGDDVRGFNLVGNPYTRNLVLGDMTIGSTPVSTVYVITDEDRTKLTAYTTDEYAVKPGEGFFVQATAASQTLTMNPAAKDAFDFRYIKIVAGNENGSDNAFVQFETGNTLRKMNIANKTSVYVIDNGDDYAAATINELAGSIPVHFKAVADGNYTITVNAKNLDVNTMLLFDNFTGETIDLLENPSYTFKATTNDEDNRFKLIFDCNNYTGIDENFTGDIFAYQYGNEIIVNGEGTLEVFDVMGRMVLNTKVNGVQKVNVPANNVYIFKLMGETVKTQKIVVR